jgi:hypothetical protein
MPEKKSRFVHLCQQFLAFGTVAALAAPAAGVVSLDIVSPTPQPQKEASAPVRTPVALVASDPVEAEVSEVPLKGLEKAGLKALTHRDAARTIRSSEVAALSAPEPVEGYATVGVTWNPDVHLDEDEVSVSVRSLQNGEWSAWQPIEYHDDHGPNPDSAEARKARQGTEPIVVGDVDQVQVKVETADGDVPAGAELAMVDPKDTPSPTLEQPAIDTADLPAEGAVSLSAATTATPDADPAEGTTDPTPDDTTTDGTDPDGDGVLTGAVGVTPKPKIFSRAQWGADERMRDKSSLQYYEIHAGFVHHTVNANGYTRDQVPSLMRGIYAYHTQSRGWSDIGYNFIVDRFGRIWEGRYGGVDRPVVGAHTLGYDEYSFAMSALGNFDTAKPSSAMVDAYGRLFAWKLSLHGVSASSTKQWVGKKYFPAVNGHRDAGQTACPGRYLYAQLGQIRSLAAKYQAPFTSRSRSANLAGTHWPDIAVRHAGNRKVYLLRTGGQTNFTKGRVVAGGWDSMDLIAAAHDLTGDGIPDVVGRSKATKRASVYPGTAAGKLGAPLPSTPRFAKVDQLVGVLDLNGDRKKDLVARVAGTPNLYLHRGRNNGTFRKRKLISNAWGAYDLTAGVGDFSGDGRNDLAARKGDRLYLVPGVVGGLGKPVALPGKWGQYSMITGAGDLTKDGKPDILVKVRKTMQTFIYPGAGNGRFGSRLGPFAQFKNINYLAVGGHLLGDSSVDLVGRDRTGSLRFFPHNGGKNVEAVTSTGLKLGAANLLLNVGDWNGDGIGDIMSRTPKGVLHLRRGNGRGGFEPAVVAGTGWKSVGLVAAVGDITGDGYPDLMGQPAGKAMRIYPGNGSTGFLTSYVAHSAIGANRHTGLGLWDSDGSPDSLVRRSDGALLLYRGNGPGGMLNPSKIGAGTKSYDWLQSVGDATGDGRPDVIARESATGRLWLLPGTRTGLAARRLVADGFGGYDLSS